MKRRLFNDSEKRKRIKNPTVIMLDQSISSPMLKKTLTEARNSSLRLSKARREQSRFVLLELLLDGEYMEGIFSECAHGTRFDYRVAEMFGLVIDTIKNSESIVESILSTENTSINTFNICRMMEYVSSDEIWSKMLQKIPRIVLLMDDHAELSINQSETIARTDPLLYADYICARYPNIPYGPSDPITALNIIRGIQWQSNAADVICFIIRGIKGMMGNDDFVCELISTCKSQAIEYRNRALARALAARVSGEWSFVNPLLKNGTPLDTLLFLDEMESNLESIYPITWEIVNCLEVEPSERIKHLLAEQAGYYAHDTTLVDDIDFMVGLIEREPECTFLLPYHMRRNKKIILTVARFTNWLDWWALPEEWFSHVDFCYSLASSEGWYLLSRMPLVCDRLVEMAINQDDQEITRCCKNPILLSERIRQFPHHITVLPGDIAESLLDVALSSNPQVIQSITLPTLGEGKELTNIYVRHSYRSDLVSQRSKQIFLRYLAKHPSILHYLPCFLRGDKDIIESIVRSAPQKFCLIHSIVLESMDDDFLSRILSINPVCGMSRKMPTEFRSMMIQRDNDLLEFVDEQDPDWIKLWGVTHSANCLFRLIVDNWEEDKELFVFLSHLVKHGELVNTELGGSNWIILRDSSPLEKHGREILFNYELNAKLLLYGYKPCRTLLTSSDFLIYLIRNQFNGKQIQHLCIVIDSNHDIYKQGLFLSEPFASFLLTFQSFNEVYNYIPSSMYTDKHMDLVRRVPHLLLFGKKLHVTDQFRVEVIVKLVLEDQSNYDLLSDKNNLALTEALVRVDPSLEVCIFSSPHWDTILSKDSFDQCDIPYLELLARLMCDFNIVSLKSKVLSRSFYDYMALQIGYVDISTIIGLSPSLIYSLVKKRFQQVYPSIPFYITQ